MDYDLGYDLEEAMLREGLTKSDIDAVRNPEIPGVPKTITDKQLALFLNACGSVVEARKVIKIYYDARQNAPEHFDGRDPDMETIKQCFQCQDYIYLPLTPDNHLLVFHRLSDTKPSHYNFDHAIKTFFMTIDLCLYKMGPRPGITFLFDMKGVGIGHLTRIKISSIRKFFHYLQEALPAKLHSIHVLNAIPLIDKILAIMKPFMKAEILNMIHLHTSSMDHEKFYAECLPKSCLPSDFGGDLGSVKELQESSVKEFIKQKKYFIAEDKQRSSCDMKNIKEAYKRMESLEID